MQRFGIEALSDESPRFAIRRVCLVHRGERFVEAIGVVEDPPEGKARHRPLLGGPVGIVGQCRHPGDLGIVRGELLTDGQVAVGIGEIGVDREGAAKRRDRFVEPAQRPQSAAKIIP